MYNKNWIQRGRRGLIHSYESCSLAHDDKMAQLLEKGPAAAAAGGGWTCRKLYFQIWLEESSPNTWDADARRTWRFTENRDYCLESDSPSGGGGSAGWSSSVVVSTFLSCSWTQRKLLVWSEGESDRLFFSPSVSLQWGRRTNCFLVSLRWVRWASSRFTCNTQVCLIQQTPATPHL